MRNGERGGLGRCRRTTARGCTLPSALLLAFQPLATASAYAAVPACVADAGRPRTAAWARPSGQCAVRCGSSPCDRASVSPGAAGTAADDAPYICSSAMRAGEEARARPSYAHAPPPRARTRSNCLNARAGRRYPGQRALYGHRSHPRQSPDCHLPPLHDRGACLQGTNSTCLCAASRGGSPPTGYLSSARACPACPAARRGEGAMRLLPC